MGGSLSLSCSLPLFLSHSRALSFALSPFSAAVMHYAYSLMARIREAQRHRCFALKDGDHQLFLLLFIAVVPIIHNFSDFTHGSFILPRIEQVTVNSNVSVIKTNSPSNYMLECKQTMLSVYQGTNHNKHTPRSSYTFYIIYSPPRTRGAH